MSFFIVTVHVILLVGSSLSLRQSDTVPALMVSALYEHAYNDISYQASESAMIRQSANELEVLRQLFGVDSCGKCQLFGEGIKRVIENYSPKLAMITVEYYCKWWFNEIRSKGDRHFVAADARKGGRKKKTNSKLVVDKRGLSSHDKDKNPGVDTPICSTLGNLTALSKQRLIEQFDVCQLCVVKGQCSADNCLPLTTLQQSATTLPAGTDMTTETATSLGTATMESVITTLELQGTTPQVITSTESEETTQHMTTAVEEKTTQQATATDLETTTPQATAAELDTTIDQVTTTMEDTTEITTSDSETTVITTIEPTTTPKVTTSTEETTTPQLTTETTEPAATTERTCESTGGQKMIDSLIGLACVYDQGFECIEGINCVIRCSTAQNNCSFQSLQCLPGQTCRFECEQSACNNVDIECSPLANCSIDCQQGDCSNMKVNATDSVQLDIACAGEDACMAGSLICPHIGDCNLECTGQNSCRDIQLQCSAQDVSSDCNITCSNEDNTASSCLQAKIDCGVSNCHFDCESQGTTGKEACKGMAINAELATSFDIDCVGTDACAFFSTTCPTNADCDVMCAGNFACFQSSVSSATQTTKDTTVHCKQESGDTASRACAFLQLECSKVDTDSKCQIKCINEDDNVSNCWSASIDCGVTQCTFDCLSNGNSQRTCEEIEIDASTASASTIRCNGTEACAFSELKCPTNGNCLVVCDGTFACFDSVVDSSVQSMSSTLVKCQPVAEDVSNTCQDLVLKCSSVEPTSQCSVECLNNDNDAKSCANLDLNCGVSQCQLDCDAQGSGAQTCEYALIDAEIANSLTVDCQGTESCQRFSVDCPTNGACNISCAGQFSCFSANVNASLSTDDVNLSCEPNGLSGAQACQALVLLCSTVDSTSNCNTQCVNTDSTFAYCLGLNLDCGVTQCDFQCSATANAANTCVDAQVDGATASSFSWSCDGTNVCGGTSSCTGCTPTCTNGAGC